MSRNSDAKPSPWLHAPEAAGGDATTFPPFAARDDLVALLWLAGLDTDLGRLGWSVAAILEPLERRCSELAEALKWDEAGVLAMSRELQTTTTDLRPITRTKP